MIGSIHRYHDVGGANGTTMVVMFLGLLWWGRRTFPYYSYCRNPSGQEFFVPARIHRGIPVNTVHINCFGSLQDWIINEARNKDYWNQLVKRLLHPDTPTPERPETWGPLPSWRARQAANRQCPTDHDADYDKDDENSSNAGSNNGDGNRENHHDKGSHGPGQRQHPPLPWRAPPRAQATTAVQFAPPCSIQSKTVAQR
jgi:hypothetical protein